MAAFPTQNQMCAGQSVSKKKALGVKWNIHWLFNIHSKQPTNSGACGSTISNFSE